MKSIIYLIILLCISVTSFSQLNMYKHTQEKYTSFTGGTTLNSRLYQYFNENINWEKYDSLCLYSNIFVKFTAGNKKVSDIKFSDDLHPFLNNVIRKALLSTSRYWEGTKDEVYFLPFVFVFENQSCRPTKKLAGVPLNILENFSGDPKRYTLPGDADYTPLKCIILNPYLIQPNLD